MSTYQRLVKTTPKPSATKNRRGELVALLLELELSPPVVVAALLAAVVVDAILMEASSSRIQAARFALLRSRFRFVPVPPTASHSLKGYEPSYGRLLAKSLD